MAFIGAQLGIVWITKKKERDVEKKRVTYSLERQKGNKKVIKGKNRNSGIF